MASYREHLAAVPAIDSEVRVGREYNRPIGEVIFVLAEEYRTVTDFSVAQELVRGRPAVATRRRYPQGWGRPTGAAEAMPTASVRRRRLRERQTQLFDGIQRRRAHELGALHRGIKRRMSTQLTEFAVALELAFVEPLVQRTLLREGGLF